MKPNYLHVVVKIALCFSAGYLITNLIVKKMYVDATFAAVIVILFGLLTYSMKKGK